MVDKSYGTHKQKYCVLNGGALVLLLPSLARRHSNKAFVYFEINLKWLLLMCMCMQNGSRDLTSSAGVKMDMRTEPTGAQAMPVVYRGGEGCQSVPCSTFMASRRSCHFAVSLCHSLTVPPLPPPHLHDLISTTPHPPTPTPPSIIILPCMASTCSAAQTPFPTPSERVCVACTITPSPPPPFCLAL